MVKRPRHHPPPPAPEPPLEVELTVEPDPEGTVLARVVAILVELGNDA